MLKKSINVFIVRFLLVVSMSGDVFASSNKGGNSQQTFPNYKIEQISKLVNKSNKTMYARIKEKKVKKIFKNYSIPIQSTSKLDK